MTELIDTARLHQIAYVADQPGFAPRAEIPVMRWIIDEATGRPVSHWVLAKAETFSHRSLTSYDQT